MKPASRPANRSETRPKAAKKNSIDPFFDFAWGSNYFACLPVVGAIPLALRPCLWGVADSMEGPSIWYFFGLPDPLHDIPLLKARRLIHGLFLVPHARHLRLLLPPAGIGSHDRPVFTILVPRAGDRPAVEQWSGQGRCGQREHQGLTLLQQPRRIQPPHAEQQHDWLASQ